MNPFHGQHFVDHRQVTYLNNVIDCDHGKLKRIINPMLGLVV
ncbi:Uncharacterised protein [Yersinia aleksiciae]|nr:Uncharacterised protein [Yersinia aleksiciae]